VIDVPVMGATKTITVRPWTMAIQDECLPLVSGLIDQYTAWTEKPEVFSIGEMVTRFHKEVGTICQHTCRAELAEREIEWGALWGEDLFGLAQAIWTTSIIRPGGGGVLGKAMQLAGPLILQHLQRRNVAHSPTSPTSDDSSDHPSSTDASKTSETSSPPGSPSSPDVGVQDHRPSVMN
jgi:hypothetical protein